MDCLAFQAASGYPLHNLQPWLDDVTKHGFVEAAEWIWYLFKPGTRWDGNQVLFPAGPLTHPDVSVLPAVNPQVAARPEEQAELNIKIATCNVLSLKPPSHAAVAKQSMFVEASSTGPARQESLLQQFHDAGIHIFAWQETRLRKLYNRHDERYWLFRSPATAHGHYGILIGLQRALPIGQKNQQDVFISEHEISIISAAPRFLILRLHNPLLKCIIIAAHAPHTGTEESLISDWWTDLAAAIPPKYQQWDRLLLSDANARVGSEPTEHVGDHQAEPFDPKAEGFLSFLSQQGLWAPATFSRFHKGLGMTWRHAQGQWFRNDFVCIPLCWQLLHCSSWISMDIDVGLAKEDHRAAIVHLQRRVCTEDAPCRPQHLTLRLNAFDPNLLRSLTPPNWDSDVHTHAKDFQSAIVDELCDFRDCARPKILRATMSESTWHLVLEKKQARNLLHERPAIQRRTLMEAWFACWRHACVDCPLDTLVSAFDDLLVDQDRLIALAYHRFRTLGVHVSRALRLDDVGFYTSLLRDCADFLRPQDVKHLWGVVRRSLPKYQQRRLSVRPAQLAQLEDQWLPHYAELEAGIPVRPEGLVHDCAFEQALRRLDAPLQLQLKELPSLTQLEQAFRSCSAGKATGFDPLPSALFHSAPAHLAALYHDLALKEFVWQCEPIQDKGGPVALIPKTLHPQTAKQFRGILLLPSVGKRTHAILRTQIMAKLAPVRAPGQLGGFPGQQVTYGSHALRTFGTLCDNAGLSCAILFLDLASAFHHLVRESVVGAWDGRHLEPVFAALQQSGHARSNFQCFAKLPGLLSDIGIAEPIVRLLRDIHIGTWCTIHDRWMLRTHRGTRPGSPLADIIFHALMVRVAQSIDDWIHSHSDFMALLKELDVEVPTILWADDIAVPLATRKAPDLIPFLQAALEHVHTTLHGYGFTLNFSKGKTSAVLTLKGPGSGELRKQYQLHANPGVSCTFGDGHTEWLHFVSSYRHLGTLFASNHALQCELQSRVGIAKSAFAQLTKPILANKYLPGKLRLQLFQSLITTKLFFGLGAWSTPTPKQLQYIQGALIAMLRKVLRISQERLPVDRILKLANTAEIRARLAVDRLLYAQRLFRTGPPFLHHLLHTEFRQIQHSWMHGLRADLAWMEEVSPHCLPAGWKTDLTSLIDWWQEPTQHWNHLVKKVWKLHLTQNAIMADAKMLHAGIFRNLRASGATFDTAFEDFFDWDERFDCFCGSVFTTKRGLLAHQRRTHAIFSAEHQFLQGCTCLHCGKFLWSTQRLQQHLAYIPKALGYNPCFHALQSQDRQVPYCKIDEGCTPSFAGLHRRECLQTEGPAVSPCTTQDIQRAATQAALDDCNRKLIILHQPPDPLGEGERIGEELTQATLTWFQQFYPQGPSDAEKDLLADAWVEVLCARCFTSEVDLDPWLEMVFLLWGEHWMPDLLATLEDGVAELDIDHLFADFAAQLDRYRLLAQRAHLIYKLGLCEPLGPKAHRPLPTGVKPRCPKVNSKTIQEVPRPFADQIQWQQHIRQMNFLDLPTPKACPRLSLPNGEEAFLVIHLFSGRRRREDVHDALYEFAASSRLKLIVLSLDTAVSSEFGDLALDSASWRMLEQIHAAGAVGATLIGSPCETFSEARFMVPEDLPPGTHLPRPLRSAERLLGLEGLTGRELRQCHLGGNFFQQGALVLSYHMKCGGFFVSEHPARPRDDTRPSIWTSAILQVLVRHPDAKLSHICQFKWGATVTKPTGLLHYQMPNFCKDLYQCADTTAVRPREVAIGRDATGQFKTAKHKEYPARFCRGLAFTILQALTAANRQRAVQPVNLPDHLLQWVHGAARASSYVHRQTWMPDYQGN